MDDTSDVQQVLAMMNSYVVGQESEKLLQESIDNNKIFLPEDIHDVVGAPKDVTYQLYLGEYMAYLHDNPNKEKEDEILEIIDSKNISPTNIMHFYYEYSTRRSYYKIIYMLIRLSREEPYFIPGILTDIRGKYTDIELYFEGVKDIIDKKKVEDYIDYDINFTGYGRGRAVSGRDIYILFSLIRTDFSRMKEIFRRALEYKPDFLDDIILNQV